MKRILVIFWALILSVAAGEAVICYLLGIPLTKGLERTHIFKDGNK